MNSKTLFFVSDCLITISMFGICMTYFGVYTLPYFLFFVNVILTIFGKFKFK